MSYSNDTIERLRVLVESVENAVAKNSRALTYRAIPYLVEIDQLISEPFAQTKTPDRELLCDGTAMLRYLAESYDRMLRFAVSVRYYQRAISSAYALFLQYGEQVPDLGDLFYSALKARNYYVNDDCADLCEMVFPILKEKGEELYRNVMERPRSLKHDSVEMTEAYLEAIDEVEEILENEFADGGRGSCHALWQRKKDLLSERGILWHSPSQLNPRVRFD
ncbi:MAG: hypothetical protein IKC63_06885 [Clostridia bacterium]|nr:hypothetical protein [Clostridia bacterium]